MHAIRPNRLFVASLFFGSVATLALLTFALLSQERMVAIALGTLGVLLLFILYALRRYEKDIHRIATYIQKTAEQENTANIKLPLRVAPSVQQLYSAIGFMESKWQGNVDSLISQLEIEQTILDSLPDPLLLLDAHSNIIRANRAAFDVFGAKLIGQHINVLVHDKMLNEAINDILEGEPPQVIELVWNGPIIRTYQVRIAPFRRFWDGPFGLRLRDDVTDEDPNWPAAMLMMNDITTVKRSEESRIDFIANISHELRTPLASLIGFIETIRGPAKNDTEAKDRFLGIMQDQASRMSRLVSDLLQLSRVELQEHNTPTDRINLIKLLSNLWASLELRAAERNMTINVEAPRELPDILGDWDQLIQAMTNLVENAIKYAPENTEITVTAQITHDGINHQIGAPREVVSIAVADQGEGIPKEHLTRLTERFYRTDAVKAKRIPGTGLGLAIVKHIINRHRGRLTVSSEIGRGTTFTVYLPAADDEIVEEVRPVAVGVA